MCALECRWPAPSRSHKALRVTDCTPSAEKQQFAKQSTDFAGCRMVQAVQLSSCWPSLNGDFLGAWYAKPTKPMEARAWEGASQRPLTAKAFAASHLQLRHCEAGFHGRNRGRCHRSKGLEAESLTCPAVPDGTASRNPLFPTSACLCYIHIHFAAECCCSQRMYVYGVGDLKISDRVCPPRWQTVLASSRGCVWMSAAIRYTELALRSELLIDFLSVLPRAHGSLGRITWGRGFQLP